jgi:glycosyltransferase involved in cell wall biosynthesis
MARSFDGPVVGSLGRLERQKGFDVLLRAMAEVPEARLVIVGDGDERAALESLAERLDLGSRVRFEGWHEEPRRWLTTFDVFALPSRLEGFPLSIVEAMLAKLPVVATPVGSVAEAVRDGETGLLVSPEDPVALARALRELVGDEARRSAMGTLGRERAKAFTADAMIAAYQALYDEVSERR